MAVYILLSTADPLASAGLLSSGSAGAENQRKALELMGATLISQYVVSGAYDLVTIADFPSDEAVIAYSLMCNMEGFATEQLRAFSPGEIDEAARLLEPFLTVDEDQGGGTDHELS